MSTPTRLMTYEEARTLPDLGERYELIDGVLIVPSSPSTIHARAKSRLLRILGEHLRPQQRLDFVFPGLLDVRLTQFRSVQPDLLYVDPDGPPILTTYYVDGAPDLVVEVVSPSTRFHDCVTKFGFYAEAGVREYWIVDPDQAEFTLYSLIDGRFVDRVIDDGIARSLVLPGLEVKLADVFAGLREGIPGK